MMERSDGQRQLHVLLTLPLCVAVVVFLLDRPMWDVPLALRIAGAFLGGLFMWLLLAADGLLARVRADPVMVGAGLLLVGTLLGLIAVPILNRLARPGATAEAVMTELPVIDLADRGPVAPHYSRSRVWVAAPLVNRMVRDWGHVVVSRSPFPPHERLMLTVDDREQAWLVGCVVADVRIGLLGFPVAGRASAAPCSGFRGARGDDIVWKGGPFEDWRWADQPDGSSRDESP